MRQKVAEGHRATLVLKGLGESTAKHACLSLHRWSLFCSFVGHVEVAVHFARSCYHKQGRQWKAWVTMSPPARAALTAVIKALAAVKSAEWRVPKDVQASVKHVSGTFVW